MLDATTTVRRRNLLDRTGHTGLLCKSSRSSSLSRRRRRLGILQKDHRWKLTFWLTHGRLSSLSVVDVAYLETLEKLCGWRPDSNPLCYSYLLKDNQFCCSGCVSAKVRDEDQKPGFTVQGEMRYELQY